VAVKAPALVFKEATLRDREVARDKAQAWDAVIPRDPRVELGVTPE
jgi:hypothetical protein